MAEVEKPKHGEICWQELNYIFDNSIRFRIKYKI
jgi:hypothetical protein